jgi:glycosyltransferase involved in cell wall biosynthesis
VRPEPPTEIEPAPTEPRLRVALLGSRGIPGRYGGYETLMEELAGRLVAGGFDVTVYCRSHLTPRHLASWRGARLVTLPTLRTKHLDTPIHMLLSALHATAERYDAALIVNSANALFVPLLRAAGVATALHVDGIEKRRAKWGPLGRSVYALSERLACFVADRVITDAAVIRDHYRSRYGCDSTVLTYGVAADPPAAGETLQRLGLEPRRYFLYVSRFEPENNPHRVAEAYRQFRGDLPLVMVGDAPYASAFLRGWRDGADRRIVFPGSVYGAGYRELLAHALAYVHATEVGGTHPALVEAMGYGNCVVVHQTPENEEVAGQSALYFDVGEPRTLARHLSWLAEHPEEAARLGRLARERAGALFDWDDVARGYALLLREIARP